MKADAIGAKCEVASELSQWLTKHTVGGSLIPAMEIRQRAVRMSPTPDRKVVVDKMQITRLLNVDLIVVTADAVHRQATAVRADDQKAVALIG